jgi:hypothetical protein
MSVAAAQPVDKPSRAALLEWLRENAPDLRIGRMLIGEHRSCHARFTFAGEVFELEAKQPDHADPDDEVVRLAADAMRKAMNLPPASGRQPARSGIEQQIVAAELSGDAAEVAFLTRELMTGRRRETFGLRIQPSWGKRTI